MEEVTHIFVPGAEFPYQYKYAHMAITTDCVIFTFVDGKLKVLLIRRGETPYNGMWALPGGFLRINETVEEGALRELEQETHLKITSFSLLGLYSEVDRDPRERVITIAWYALVRHAPVEGGDDAREAAWFPVDEVPPLAFDHDKIFASAREQLRQDIYFKPVGFELLGEEFTMPALHKLYEAILGRELDRRNFQRKMLASGVLRRAGADEDIIAPDNDEVCIASAHRCMSYKADSGLRIRSDNTKREHKSTPGRPGALFNFSKEGYEDLKKEKGKLEF